MKSLEISFKKTIRKEEKRNSQIEKFRELDALITMLDSEFPKKSEYSFPLADTIGKKYYQSNLFF